MMRVVVVILGITVGVGWYNVTKVLQKLKNEIEIKVFVNQTKELERVRKEIEKIEEIEKVTVVQQKEVVSEFREKFKINTKLFKGTLPPIINIKVKSPTEVKEIVKKLEKMKKIDDVIYPKRYLTVLLTIEKLFTYSMWGIGGLVFIIIVCLLWMGGELECQKKGKKGIKFSLIKGIEMCGITGGVVVVVYFLATIFKNNIVMKRIELPPILWGVIFSLLLGGVNFLVTLHKK